MRGDSGGDGAMRRCSQCGHNGHNARTCPGRGVRLFGVRIAEGSIRKSVSMGNISHYAAAIGGASPGDGGAAAAAAAAAECGDGYASEGFEAGNASARRERKKGGRVDSFACLFVYSFGVMDVLLCSILGVWV